KDKCRTHTCCPWPRPRAAWPWSRPCRRPAAAEGPRFAPGENAAGQLKSSTCVCAIPCLHTPPTLTHGLFMMFGLFFRSAANGASFGKICNRKRQKNVCVRERERKWRKRRAPPNMKCWSFQLLIFFHCLSNLLLLLIIIVRLQFLPSLTAPSSRKRA